MGSARFWSVCSCHPPPGGSLGFCRTQKYALDYYLYPFRRNWHSCESFVLIMITTWGCFFETHRKPKRLKTFFPYKQEIRNIEGCFTWEDSAWLHVFTQTFPMTVNFKKQQHIWRLSMPTSPTTTPTTLAKIKADFFYIPQTEQTHL